MKVKDEPDLVRQPNGTIQNTNTAAYQAFVAKRKAVLDNESRLLAIEKDNAEIKASLSHIIQLLLDK